MQNNRFKIDAMNIAKQFSSDQDLANFIPIAIVLLNNKGDITWFNRSAEQLFALKQAAHLNINSIIPSINFKLYFDQAKMPIEITIQMESKRHLSLSLIPYLNNQYLLVCQDVTHVHHLERMRQDFVANVSHELRTPLTVIHGYLESLLDKYHSSRSRIKSIFKQMYQQTLRMEKLVENLLFLARLENETLDEEFFKPIDVPLLVQRIAEDAKALSGKRKHQITLRLDKKLKIYGLANALQSAFANIIFNAIHYTPGGGNITIDWHRDNDYAYLKVEDEGIGISAEHLSRVTERFYRVDRARSRESGGTGLGLAIVKHALICHQAQLRIESEVGKGSIFTCVFPKSLIAIN